MADYLPDARTQPAFVKVYVCAAYARRQQLKPDTALRRLGNRIIAYLKRRSDSGEYRRVSLDTENYRKKREETLVRLANRVAAKVVKTGRKVIMEPMNPYERRILHATLQSNARVETVSEGEEPYRRVIVKKKR